MGLFLRLVAKKPRRLFAGVLSRETDWLSKLATFAKSRLTSLGMDTLIPPATGDPTLLRLHYCEEVIDLADNGKAITFSARTTSCGPGYHAFLCDMLDAFGKKHGFIFAEDDEFRDSTDFYRDRDFRKLQEIHARWLKNVVSLDEALNDGQQHFVSLSIKDWLPYSESDQLLTPLGPISKEVISEFSTANSSELLKLAETWFPWWSELPSGNDWRKTGLTLLWNEVPWHKPASDSERHVMAASLKCFEAANSLGIDVSQYAAELAEITRFLSDIGESVPPNSDGIGYRRKTCVWALVGGWSVKAPGYWYRFGEGDDQGLTFGDKTIWTSSLSLAEKDSSQVSREEIIDLGPLRSEDRIVFEAEEFGLRYRLITQQPEGNLLKIDHFLQVNSSSSILFLTFSSENVSWEPELIEMARSARYPGAQLPEPTHIKMK